MRVSNITACFAVAKAIDLTAFAAGCLFARRTSGFGKKRRFFDSVRLSVYTTEKRITALIYRSGRVVLIGADRETQLIDAAGQITCLLRSVVKEPIKISNYVFAFDLRKRVNLCTVYNELRRTNDPRIGSIQYEPELFPALILKINMRHMERESKATMFQTGKVNITGCRKREEGTKMKDTILDLLCFLIE